MLPKILPGPNFHFRFMKNCIHTSLLGSLVNAQQISKGEFWQIPLPFTDFLVSIILLGSSLLPASPLFQYFSLPCLQFSGLLQVLGNAISIPVPNANIFYCRSSSLLLFKLAVRFRTSEASKNRD